MLYTYILYIYLLYVHIYFIKICIFSYFFDKYDGRESRGECFQPLGWNEDLAGILELSSVPTFR